MDFKYMKTILQKATNNQRAKRADLVDATLHLYLESQGETLSLFKH